jgi:membrane-associated phospholipid phosphatase
VFVAHLWSVRVVGAHPFAGLFIDLLCVAIVKVGVRRARPDYATNDDQFLAAPAIDFYSMPSGHTSRAAMLVTMACVRDSGYAHTYLDTGAYCMLEVTGGG